MSLLKSQTNWTQLHVSPTKFQRQTSQHLTKCYTCSHGTQLFEARSGGMLWPYRYWWISTPISHSQDLKHSATSRFPYPWLRMQTKNKGCCVKAVTAIPPALTSMMVRTVGLSILVTFSEIATEKLGKASDGARHHSDSWSILPCTLNKDWAYVRMALLVYLLQPCLFELSSHQLEFWAHNVKVVYFVVMIFVFLTFNCSPALTLSSFTFYNSCFKSLLH